MGTPESGQKPQPVEKYIFVDHELQAETKRLLQEGFMPGREVNITMVENPREAVGQLKNEAVATGGETVIIESGYTHQVWVRKKQDEPSVV